MFAGYPALDYATAIHAGTVPPNVTVNEFFFEAGQWLGSPYAQQHYISANYTHALGCVLDRGVNVVAQLVAHRDERQRAPVQPELQPRPHARPAGAAPRRAASNFLFAGETNSELPFMGGDAAIGADEFDLLLDNPALDFPLFAPPREPIALADYAAGLARRHASCRTAARCRSASARWATPSRKALILRHRNNDDFRNLHRAAAAATRAARCLAHRAVRAGLYGCTEMFVEGLLDLYRAGILKREVDGAVLHAGFFLGSRAFYRALREMPRGRSPTNSG